MACVGRFQYLDPETEPSLYRNGKLYTKRMEDGSDGEWIGIRYSQADKEVRNARQHEMRLDRNGFELVADSSTTGVDYLDNVQVIAKAYPAAEELVKRHTGARKVVAFDHNVRSAGGVQAKKVIEGGQAVQPPARIVHGDYTIWSARERLVQLTKPPHGSDTLAGTGKGALLAEEDLNGRFAIINVWRNITDQPVARDPFAFSDAQTVAAEDLCTFEVHYPHRVGENYFARDVSGKHVWYYYPAMVREEALLLKQWDTAGRLAQSKGALDDGGGVSTLSLHSAFDNNAPADAPQRWSCEIRTAVIY
eukprot:CAMPEP_0119134706 /NCGR_PEP_ID=MMETSP1310-20130426/17628_1 /TAXON_ID=464262 /ORGANISM="Genus nov. species nov., Strain RCC2339" /LENGTH=305 /DNA_ID=CAMNT_0007125531 /DNA_START=60 /DNA_END=977 /DNA_ORIENTATION=+